MMQKTTNGLLLLLLIAITTTKIANAAPRDIRFVSPLQSLTIPDPECMDASVPAESAQEAALETPRRKFMERWKFGLKVEQTVREKLAMGKLPSEDNDDGKFDASGPNWVGNAKAAEEQRRAREASMIEKGYDSAMAQYDEKLASIDASKAATKTPNPNKYQFVGLIDRKNSEKPISWHARPKPEGAKWSVRLVHVNKDAIIKDLFDQGKIDIFAKYTNTGKFKTKGSGENAKPTTIPIVTAKYEGRKRSWKNLNNFSPKHFFSDSSGAYWRERRLRPGMYTDGETVFEASYRYRDGRNGMHKVSTLKQFLSSSAVPATEKESIMKKLKEAAPDVVLEL